MNPAAAQSYGVRCVHQVAHHERTVVYIRRSRAVGEHEYYHRCAVERVRLYAHHFGIELRELVAHRLVSHYHHSWRLHSSARRGILAGSNHLFDEFVGRHSFGVETAHAAAGFKYI